MTYKESITAALEFLKDRSGSSLVAIKKQMQSCMPKDKKWLNATFLTALKSMVSAGDLIQIKSSYKLSPAFKKARLEASKPKKVAPKKKKVNAPKKSASTKKKSAPKKKKTTAAKKAAPKKKKAATAKKSATKKKKTTTTKKSAPKKKKTTSKKKTSAKKTTTKKK